LILWVFARPTLLRSAMAMSRMLRALRVPVLLSRVGGRLGFAMAMLASTGDGPRRERYAARGEGDRGGVALLLGCVMEGLLTETNRATERTLVANGYTMVNAPGQRCCGALHAHAGELEQARALARANIAAFERSRAATICSNAAGCGAMMKEYAHLLADDPGWSDRAKAISARTRDVSELLAAAGPAQGGALKRRVTYDAPCHLLHAQRIAEAPLALLRAIPALELVALEGAEHCCGAAGIYNLVEPGTSNAVLAPKLRNIAATKAELVATGNPGCLMQIGAGLRRASIPVRAVHPVDLLDASYAAREREARRGKRDA
jgi:glycolate oxidase iron-sulfur subunit